MPDLDDYERAVLRRSQRVGVIWCSFGVLGLSVGAVTLLAMLNALRQSTGVPPNPLFILAAIAWVAISLGAAKSGWRSFTKARAALGGAEFPQTDLDESLS